MSGGHWLFNVPAISNVCFMDEGGGGGGGGRGWGGEGRVLVV